MYAISFDMEISKLKKYYGESYHPAYDEIRKIMDSLGFDLVQGGLYLARESKNSLTLVYQSIDTLRKIEWFKNSVRDIRSFKVEDWSDFTEIIKS